MEMAKRIELERRGRKEDEIPELSLDNCISQSCRSQRIDGLSDKYVSLKSLSIVDVGLVDLKGFPNLRNLQKLDLSDNRVAGGLNHLVGCANLTHLSLSGNKIKDFEPLEALKDLTNLKSLDLSNCEVQNAEDYTEKVFELLPNLKYLDGYNKHYQEEEDDKDEDAGEEDYSEGEEGEIVSDAGEEDDLKYEEGEDDEDSDEEHGEEYDANYLEDDDDDEEDEEEDVDDEEEEGGSNLMQQGDLEDEDDDEDFETEGKEEGEVEEEEEDEDSRRGTKRKQEDEDEES